MTAVCEKTCEKVHQLARNLERHYFPLDYSKIPLNGIYIMFEIGETGHENGESGHARDRIVRVGTHTGADQLRSRLRQHFDKENRDRSIFRKNIGRAILTRDNDPFITFWELPLSPAIDFNYNRTIETQVSEYIRNNFSFCTFEVKDRGKRLEIESKIISTVSRCESCKPSKGWLGHYSPKNKIKKSGLWLVNELYKTPFDASGVEQLSELING